MKKILLLLLVLLLFGCTTTDNDKVDLKALIDSITLPEVLTENIILSDVYKVGDVEIKAKWVSSNPEVLTNKGVITRGSEDQEIKLTLTLTLDKTKEEKEFTITIIKKDMTLQEFIDSINIPTKVSQDLDLPDSYMLNGEEIFAIWESSNPSILTTEGVITRGLVDQGVTLTLLLTTSTDTLNKEFNITVEKASTIDFLNSALETLNIKDESKTNINLPSYVNYGGQKFTITWESNKPNAISTTGKVGLISNDTNVTLVANISYDNVNATRQFNVLVIALSDQEKADYIFNKLSIPTMTASDLNLPTSFDFELTGAWESSNLEVMSNSGIIEQSLKGQQKVTLTLTLSNNQRRTFELTVSNNNHLIIDNTFNGTKENVTVVDGKLELAENQTLGVYTTEVIETLNFSSAVASWAATSSVNATAELLIRVRVNGNWSKYFSYGEWGLGRKNAAYNQSDTVAKLSTDEIIVTSGTASAIQIQIKLRRDNISYQSAKLTLIATALNIPGYTYNVDITNLRQSVDYDVPKLYQHVVPSIGGVICSPTSSTMLLKYKGHDFTGKADYEHQYIAGLFKDNGDFNAYGNWVYNTVGMSAFGEVSYVMRMYSYQELLNHLDKVGPVSASIKGSVVVEKGKSYPTEGHLIVVRGYRFDTNGQLYIITNDPNLSNVHDEMKVENFMKVWRNVIYVIE